VLLNFVVLFFSKYTPAIDIWSIGCIFAEMLTGKPLFPGKNVVHQLDIVTDLLGTPPAETISRIRNEKARRYLSSMKKKKPIPFSQKFPNCDPLALQLLEGLIAFDHNNRLSAEEALAHPYFKSLANLEQEPSTQPISKLEFEFERRKLTKDDVRELIYREILEYHPQMLQEYLHGIEQTSFLYPSGAERFKQQFAHLEQYHCNGERSTPLRRQYTSLPRERICAPKDEDDHEEEDLEKAAAAIVRSTLASSPPRGIPVNMRSNPNKPRCSIQGLLRSSSIASSQHVGIDSMEYGKTIPEHDENGMCELSEKLAVLYANLPAG
jgi:mitogen-activated protein kinase 1/3